MLRRATTIYKDICNNAEGSMEEPIRAVAMGTVTCTLLSIWVFLFGSGGDQERPSTTLQTSQTRK